jgi:hypothetical protein
LEEERAHPSAVIPADQVFARLEAQWNCADNSVPRDSRTLPAAIFGDPLAAKFSATNPQDCRDS